MPSLNDLPEELFVEILSYLEDFDPTKIRLERVSQRFFRCLQESWKWSEERLDLEQFGAADTPQLVAVLRRMPRLSFLNLHKPEEFPFELFNEFFNQHDKIELLELKYFGGCNEDENRKRNEQLLELFFLKSAPTLITLDIDCFECNKYGTYLGPLRVGMKWLPQCKELRTLRLQDVDGNTELIVSALKDTKLTSLELCDVTDSIQTDELIELLNSIQTIQSLTVICDSKCYEGILDIEGEDENLIVLPDLCDFLNESAAHNLKSIELTIMNIDYMQYIGNIFKKLPNLESLFVDFYWFYQQTRANDVVDLMKAIQMFVEDAIKRPQSIVLDLSITREKYGEEVDFGRNSWYAVNEMQVECLTSKRNKHFTKWKQRVRKDNVELKLKVEVSNASCSCCNNNNEDEDEEE